MASGGRKIEMVKPARGYGAAEIDASSLDKDDGKNPILDHRVYKIWTIEFTRFSSEFDNQVLFCLMNWMTPMFLA